MRKVKHGVTNRSASPVCYAAEASDAYMGYATSEELIEVLTKLLEAERAGAHLAIACFTQTEHSGLAKFMEHMHADESRWCKMLSQEISSLGGTPSRRRGSFYKRAMAITDIAKRLVFLNRGQRWVVRELAALLPRVRDDKLHHALNAMRAGHEVNIGRVERLGADFIP